MRRGTGEHGAGNVAETNLTPVFLRVKQQDMTNEKLRRPARGALKYWGLYA